ncbi:MAG: hypothetical protein ACI8UO_003099 [Verrucomicrobiales bacterium]|jgi:hypothetical protein
MIAKRFFRSLLLCGALFVGCTAFAQQTPPTAPNPTPPATAEPTVPPAAPAPVPPTAVPTPSAPVPTPPAPVPTPPAPVPTPPAPVPTPPAPVPTPPAPVPVPDPIPPVTAEPIVPPAPAPDPGHPVAPASTPLPSTPPAAAPEADPEKPDPRPTIERTVYLPYDDLEKIFEKEGRGVFLPYKEFLELWNQLNLKDEDEAAKPPADGVVKSAGYVATVEGTGDQQVMIVKVDLEIESFKEDGWASVPLRNVGMNIAEAETGEAKLELLAEGGHRVLLPKAGVYKLELKLFEPITRTNGERATQLHLPLAPISKFVASIPETGWDFNLGENIAYTAVDEGGKTRLEFFFGHRGVVDLKWRKESEESKLTPLLFAETNIISRVIPGAMQTTVDLDYRILRAGVDSFEITVPKPHEVLSVDGANIKEWTVADEAGDARQLLVTLHTPARENYKLKLTLETGLVSLPVDIEAPAVQAQNAVRQSGSVSLTAAAELEVEITATDGLTQQATGAAAGNDAGTQTNLGSYRFLRAPYKMALNVKKAAPVVLVDSATTVTVEPDLTNLLTTFNYEVKRVGLFETTIALPPEFSNIDVTAGNGTHVIEDFTVAPDGSSVDIRFTQQLLGAFQFQLTGRAQRDEEDTPLIVPVFEPQNVERHDAKVGLAIHSSLEPTTDEQGGLRNEELRALQTCVVIRNPATTPLTLGFSYRGSVEPAEISFRVKESQVSGEVRTLVDIQEQVIRYHWWIDYEILYAGVDELVVKLPASIAEDLRPPASSRFKEIDRDFQLPVDPDADPAAAEDDEFVFWAFRLLDKQLGAYRIEFTLDVTNSGLQTVEVPEISLIGIHRETGQIAVTKGANLELGQEIAIGLETIDPRELKADLSREGVLKAFKYRKHPISLTLPASKNDFMQVPTIVITYADVTSVVSSDAGITTEMVYWILNNNEPSLKIQLPEGATMESDVYVDGTPQTPMKQAGSDDVYVRLPSGASVRNRSFPVRFVYEIPSAKPGAELTEWDGVVPVAELANADFNVLQSRLNLYLPNAYRYTKFEGPMQMPAEDRGWRRFQGRLNFLIPALGPKVEVVPVSKKQPPPTISNEASSGFDVPMVREGQLFTLYRLDKPEKIQVSFRDELVMQAMAVTMAILAFLIGVMLLGRSLKTKFVYFVFFGIGALAVSGLISPAFTGHAEAVFLGVLFAVGIWILGGLWWLCKPRPKPTPPDDDGYEYYEEDQDDDKPEPSAQPKASGLGGLDPRPDADEEKKPDEPERKKASPLVLKKKAPVAKAAKATVPVKLPTPSELEEASRSGPKPHPDEVTGKVKKLDLPISKPAKPDTEGEK